MHPLQKSKRISEKKVTKLFSNKFNQFPRGRTVEYNPYLSLITSVSNSCVTTISLTELYLLKGIFACSLISGLKCSLRLSDFLLKKLCNYCTIVQKFGKNFAKSKCITINLSLLKPVESLIKFLFFHHVVCFASAAFWGFLFSAVFT